MPFPIAVGDIMEFSVDMRMLGSRMLNVYHYRYKTGSTPISDGNAVFLAWLADQATDATGIPDNTRLWANENLLIQSIRAQIIYPTRRPAISYTMNVQGSRGGSPLPSGCSACISLTQALAGRSLNGRKELPGGEVDDAVADLWQPAAVTLLNAIGTAAAQERVIAAPGTIMEPVILHRSGPAGSQVVSGFQVRPQVRYLTRRTLGRGE